MRSKKLVLNLFVVVMLTLCCGLRLSAQTITGDIGGTVTDPTGAVVVGAQVTATNVATGVKNTVTTNNDGIYSVRFLPIGTYKVTITDKGFTTKVTAPFLLEVSQVAKVDAKLTAGSESTVEVTSDSTPLLNTENGMISTTISQTMIDDLPINGHNTTELTQVMPGSSVADGNQWNGSVSSPNNSGLRVQSFATLPNINGNRTYTTNFTLDGISIVDTGANLTNGFGAPAYNIPQEALQEITILSVVPPAEYGDGATQVLNTMKVGTSQYHGAASAYLQNWMMDANTFGNKRVLPGNSFTPRSKYTQSNYNVAFGGPVPHFKDKLFFFGDYEAYRLPTASTSRLNLPLNAWRGNTTAAAGAVDQSVSPLAGDAYFGSAVAQLYDTQHGNAPLNQTIGGVFYQNLVPINNPVAKYLFAHPELLPLPNEVASAAPIKGNYQNTAKTLQENNQGDIKIDYTPTDKDRFSVRYSYGDAVSNPQSQLLPISFASATDFPFQQGVLLYTRVINQSLVNEYRMGYTRVGYNSFNRDLSGQFTSGESLVGIPYTQLVPGFTLQSFTQSTNSSGVNSVGTAGTGNIAYDNQFSYGDNLTWSHGRHSTKFGAQLFRADNNFLQNTGSGLLGSFSYSGSFTGNPTTGQSVGYDFADFLLDYSSGYAVSPTTGKFGLRQYRFGVFAQDDWKVTPKLTVNYGLRWQYDQPAYEVQNKIANLNPATGALQLAGQNGNSRSLYSPTYNDFGPRVGFAYSIDPKLVLRGGFGIFTYMDYNALKHTTNAPYYESLSGTAQTPTTASAGTPFAVTNGFNTTGATQAVSFTTWNKLKPMVETQFSLVAEYAINNKQSVTVQYVGNTAQHLADERNINQEKLVGTASSAAFNSTVIAAAAGNFTIGTNAVELLETEAYSNFNAGEVTYRLRPSNGFEITVNYTYGHAMGDTSGLVSVNDNNVAGGNPQNNFCLSCEYGPSASDSRHMLNSNFSYALPFGRKGQFGRNMPLWLDEIVGGWKASGTAVLFSGQPNTITASGSSGAVGTGTLRANHYRHMKITGVKDGLYVTQNNATGVQTVDGSTGSGNSYVVAGAWGTDPSATHSGNVGTGTCGTAGFDDSICAYGQPAAAAPGSAPIFGTASVGSERAQGFRNIDAAVQKNWTLYHEHTLTFIANAYNVGNITSYNNQGRTVNGGSTWGYVQSSRSQQRQLELELKYKF
ncbi:TonB-dependent receptor [Granulicella paludicola]|uniref:TonB-dependent receptor n=1 Tax=Granulicella paludicola TaxID=474951 RepID=UPI0021E0EE6E|nr:TonB-dependent receptor [Granulicella paludicola]